MIDPVAAVSPLDGRYASKTAPLRPYVSEFALMQGRVQIEIEYLISLASLDAIPLELTEEDIADLRSLYQDFDTEDADLIKQIETTGTETYAATNHDVKAVEYFIRERAPARLAIDHWIHFALTSEDVNNLAYRLQVKAAVQEVLQPAIDVVQSRLAEMATTHRDLAMLSRTHGQPATPTTFGKELAVYVSRLAEANNRLSAAVDTLQGKLGGASGTYAAHVVAYPSVDWQTFSRSFVESLGLRHAQPTTQVNPSDDFATLFDALAGINRIMIDLDRDMWLYISQGYLGQAATDGETGSSTMPHKVNPIDFENSEGNLSKASADLRFLADYLPTSRLQRDLSDSTVKRNIGAAFAHCLIGYSKLTSGLDTVVPQENVMAADLADNPAVLAEAIQTVLRREGHSDAYERVKAATRGTAITLEGLHALVESLDLPAATTERLRALTPATYTGVAGELVDDVVDDS